MFWLALVFLSLVSVNAERNVVRTMSDAHIGSYWTQKPENIEAFFQFLQSMADPDTNVSRLILLGDFVELWLVPYAEAPKSWSELINTTDPIFGVNMTQFREALVQIANNGVGIVMLWGNHDLEAPTDEQFEEAFSHPNITKGGTSYFYQSVMYEHGHYYDLFNAPFPPERNLLYPFGYYVSRAAAETKHATSSLHDMQMTAWTDEFSDFAVDVLEDPDKMELVLWALVGVADSDLITNHDTVLVNGDPTDYTKNITIGEVISIYGSMVKDWVNMTNETYVENMLIAATTTNVDFFVRAQPPNVKISIMGHTHHEKLARLHRSDGSQVIYANSGAWVDTAKRTWIDVVYNGNNPTTVEVWSFADGFPSRLGSCAVNGTGECSTSAAWKTFLSPWTLLVVSLFSWYNIL